MVLLERTEQQARVAWEQLQGQFAALRLVVNQEKSRLTTLVEGFSRLRVPEGSGADAFDVAPREGVPQYPSTGS
jgi:16S rRNA C1402 N4-methylase RsmH